jgi:antagonist of KipI
MLEVVRPGLLATVQDLGRRGLGRFGVSPAGAMDPLALRVANRLAGNEDGAAALELTGPGAEVSFVDAARFAIAGADLGALLDGQPAASGRAHEAPAGARLSFPRRVRGARAILAVAGGIEVPRLLGSASVDLDAGLGARLMRGQRLAVGVAVAPRAVGDVGFAYEDPFRLRFVPAADPAVPAETLARFAAAPFEVSERSNRTGYRLAGEALPVAAASDRLSAPLAPGAIQLPPDGQPILLMADRQTIGGYPLLGHLVAADRPKAAQLWPGDEVRFAPVSLDEAHALARALATALGGS